LQPETFEEEKINDNDQQNIKATFDWLSHKLRFSHGGETALPAGAQDMLSIFTSCRNFHEQGEHPACRKQRQETGEV